MSVIDGLQVLRHSAHTSSSVLSVSSDPFGVVLVDACARLECIGDLHISIRWTGRWTIRLTLPASSLAP